MNQDERNAARVARNKAIGHYGEEQVALLYESKGYRHIGSNYHSRYGEIDVILELPEKKLYVFCEVKLRSTRTWGRPMDAVTPSKISKLRKTALAWYCTYDRNMTVPGRFDVAEVYCLGVGGEVRINLIENAFM